MMFKLNVDNMSFDTGLQIIQADVQVIINNEEVIHEALCIDIGLPSLVRSLDSDVMPNRWSDKWEEMPFFVCGCGDPECKAYSFIVRHLPSGEVEWTEIEEKEKDAYRVYETWEINQDEYRKEVMQVAKKFLEFVQPLDYQPYFPEGLKSLRDTV